MFVYLVTLFLVAILSFIAQGCRWYDNDGVCGYMDNRNTRYKLFVFLTALILILVAGLRYRVGTDYMNYALGYENIKRTVWASIKAFDEPGYKIVTILASKIYDDYAVMFFTLSLFTIGINIKVIAKYSDDFFFAIMLYVLIGAWHGSFNAVRQYAAGAILFAGHRYIFERKFWKFLLVVFVAFLFHRTAIVFLPIYFLARDSINTKSIVLILISTVVMTYGMDYVFQIMSYFKGTDQTAYAYMTTAVNPFRILVAFAPVFLVFFVPNDFRNNPENAFYFNMLIINAAFMLVTSSSAYLARVGIYTDIYATIAFPKLIKAFNRKSQVILILLILVLYSYFWIHEISVRESLSTFRWIFSR